MHASDAQDSANISRVRIKALLCCALLYVIAYGSHLTDSIVQYKFSPFHG